MAVNAKYHAAYQFLDRAFWWNVSLSGGPIVEQATHLCDVTRYLVGDVIEDSIQTICTRAHHKAGQICVIPGGCDVGLEEQYRVPRVTMATWRFIDGGIGTLTHTVALHGRKYEASIEVVMDGLRMTLNDPYSSACSLSVRDSRMDPDGQTVYKFENDDPYYTELEEFINAVRTGDKSAIASPYEDAAKTYSFTWAIRRAERTVL